MSTPFLSFLLDPGASSADEARTTVRSLLGQDDPGWELLLASPPVGLGVEDPRIRQGTLHEATGEFVAHVDPGGRLVDGALSVLRAAVEDSVDVDLAYSYELGTDPEGQRIELRKPVWSPVRQCGHSWTGRLTLLRRETARAAVAEGADGELELVLQVGARARSVLRVPEFLYDAPLRPDDEATRAGQVAAVEAHLRRAGSLASVEPGVLPGTARLGWALPDDLTVAAVVPIDPRRGMAWGVRRRDALESVRSLVANAGHRLQVVVVHTPGCPEELLEDLRALVGDDLLLVPFGAAFDWPAMVNRGVLATEADALLVLDQECEVSTPDLVPMLAGPLTETGVGLTGPRSLRSDGTLANAGMAWFNAKVVAAFEGLSPSSGVDDADLVGLTRECTALSGDCFALTRTTFDAVGGLNEALPTLASIDLSLKIARLGLSTLWVPDALLYRFGRRATAEQADRELVELRRRWSSPEVDDHLPHLGARQAERRLAALPG